MTAPQILCVAGIGLLCCLAVAVAVLAISIDRQGR